MEQKKTNLRCNSEYKRLYQPITEQAYLQLEAELKDFTDIVDIKTWVSIVLCDYEKLEICKKYNIAYRASRLYVHNSEEALLWLCKNQLERTDLTLEMRRYLIGKRYSYERILGAHDVASRRASSSVRGRPKKTEARYDDCAIKTQDRLAREYNVSISTIWKYYIFAEALDTIYDIDEDFASAIMRGNVKISQENVVSISKLSEKEIRNMAEYLLQEQPDFKSFSGSQKILLKANNIKNDDAVPAKAPSIKDMPQYDPDSEVASLALTIPSWISSMKRVSNASDMSKVSDNAKARLRNELDRLGNTIFDMFDVLKEEK